MTSGNSGQYPTYIDCRHLFGTGIGTYIQNLVRNYDHIEPDFPLELLAREENIPYINSFSRFRVRGYNDPIYSLAEQFRWITKIKPFKLLHVPHLNAPLLYPGKLIVTVHDVVQYAMSQFFPGVIKRIYSGPFYKILLNRADTIITVSNFTKSEIIRYYKIPADKIKVIYNGVNPFFKRIPEHESAIVRKKHQLPEDYFLYVGSVTPRKNIAGIIASYKIALETRSDLPPLVILGQYTNLNKEIPNIKSMLSDERVKKKIIFTGYLPDEDLPAIYSSASIFLFPSYYEGFGIPPLEAMACGTPVITSNRSSIPEVVDDAAWLIDPDHHEMIADAVIRLAEDSMLQEEYREKGYHQVKKYSWEDSAKKHLEIYRSAHQEALYRPTRFKSFSVPTTRRANILFLDQFGDKFGGGQVILLDIMEKLRASGLWNVFISLPNEGKFTDILNKRGFSYYCVPTWEPFSLEKITFRDMFRYALSSIRSTFYLSRKVREFGIDIIYCNGGRTFLNGAFLSLLFPMKIFFHLHLILDNRQKLAVKMLGLLPSVKSFIAVSNTLENQYKGDAVYKKIKIVANWVSPAFYEVPLMKRDSIVKEPLRVGVVGKISRGKGQWTILESLARSPVVLPIQLYIYGDPLVSEPGQWDKFNETIDALTKKGWEIQNVGFQIDTVKIYDHIDILIIPSIVPEAFGLTAIEAMAREVIVIANKSGALVEIIQDKKNGLLYEAEEFGELTELLKRFLNNQYDIVSMRDAGIETVRQLYHPEKQLNKLHDLIRTEAFGAVPLLEREFNAG